MQIPNDFEEFQRRIKGSDRIKRIKSSGIWLGLIAVLLLIAFFTSYYTVATEGRAVVKRFGRVVDIASPGLHFKLPFGIDKAYFVPTERVLKEEFGFRTGVPGQRTTYRHGDYSSESLMLTGDLNVVDVTWVVQYRITDADRYLHGVRDQTGTIRDIAEAIMRRVVGNRLGSDVLTVGRVEIANQVREEMQTTLNRYDMGITISSVEPQDVIPPGPVKPSFDKVNEARQARERLVNDAEKERNRVIPRARGQAEQVISQAQAYEARVVNEARGEASRFTAILEEYQKAKGVTRRRLFLEMLDDVLPNVSSIYVIDSETGGPLPLLNLDSARRQEGN